MCSTWGDGDAVRAPERNEAAWWDVLQEYRRRTLVLSRHRMRVRTANAIYKNNGDTEPQSAGKAVPATPPPEFPLRRQLGSWVARLLGDVTGRALVLVEPLSKEDEVGRLSCSTEDEDVVLFVEREAFVDVGVVDVWGGGELDDGGRGVVSCSVETLTLKWVVTRVDGRHGSEGVKAKRTEAVVQIRVEVPRFRVTGLTRKPDAYSACGNFVEAFTRYSGILELGNSREYMHTYADFADIVRITDALMNEKTSQLPFGLWCRFRIAKYEAAYPPRAESHIMLDIYYVQYIMWW
ncbi:hypothetical protein C8Q74DRAFT_1222931 [Fomes fomentarius]|nr:hypothetical protein C8Q74DRAFT_1222931 [Fomes fomentarius]